MHISSYVKMEKFVDQYLKKYSSTELKILDIGSQDVNGSYKNIFNKPGWKYVGCDIAEGKNVDIVLKDIYNWSEIKSNHYDVIISGQAFEHIEFFWITMLEITRVLKIGGLCCIIAPSSGFEHKYPIDCWRFFPDGLKALAKYSGLEILEVYTEMDDNNYSDGSEVWKDSILIAKKPDFNLRQALKMYLKNALSKVLVNYF